MHISSFSDAGFRLRRGDETLMYLLGLFSTWQILQFAGFSLSTWLIVLSVGYLVLTRGFECFRKDWLLIAMTVCAVATLGCSFTAHFPSGYMKVAFSGALQWLLILLLCLYMRSSADVRCTNNFFRGFTLSCKIQILWCFLQLICYYGLKLDINAKLFGELLNMSAETSQYRNGVLACTGLHWHAANMIPIMVYLYFCCPGMLWKILCLVAMYFTKNATAIIALGLSVMLSVVRFIWRAARAKEPSVPRKVVIWILIGLGCIIVAAPLVFPKVWQMLEYLLLRFSQISNPTVGNESSATHFSYYQQLPNILSKIPILFVIFGSGLGTSGHWFSRFLGQYPGKIWVVESDPVNILLNQGVLGALVHYAFLGFCVFRMIRNDQSNRAFFLLVMIVCGVVYNNQFVWVQLLELMMFCQLFLSKPTEKR